MSEREEFERLFIILYKKGSFSKKDKNNRCCACGKFLKLTEKTKIDFTPDTPFNAERIEYTCEKCIKAGKK